MFDNMNRLILAIQNAINDDVKEINYYNNHYSYQTPEALTVEEYLSDVSFLLVLSGNWQSDVFVKVFRSNMHFFDSWEEANAFVGTMDPKDYFFMSVDYGYEHHSYIVTVR